MPVLNTVDEFLQTIVRSGLLDRPRLDAFAQQLAGEGPVPDQPAALARLMIRDGLLTAFQANLLLAGKWQGFFLLSKYKLLDVIGSGGMGKVFLCEHMMLRRMVAVKVLPRAKTENPLAVERFYREARAVAALDHPNIVRAFDVDRDGMLHFLIMEYVDGSSLETIVSMHGAMDVGRAAHYIRQAALGLHHAHQAGWVHRDIKPANILLARDGTIKILDMGLARLFSDDKDKLTVQHGENAVLGTADYIAPEQAVSSHEVDIRADVYSLGGTFYFLLTGQPPFHEGSMAQKLIWHQMRQPKSVLALRPEVPAPLAAIVDKMLAKSPDQRYATPGELAEALLPFAPASLPPPPDKEMPRKDPPNLGPAAHGPGPHNSVGFASIKSLMLDSHPGPRSPAPAARPPVRTPAPPDPAPAPPLSPARITVTDSGTRPAMPPSPRTSTSAAPVVARSPAASTATALPPEPPAKKGVLLPLLVIGAILIAAGAAGGYYLLAGRALPPPTSSTASLPTVPDEPVLRVTRIQTSPWWGKPNTYDSVQKALAAAKAGDRIVVMDSEWAEALTIDGSKLAKNLTLESSPPSKDADTVWRLPTERQLDGGKAPPILTLANIEGLRIKRIVFDGEGYPAHLLSIGGRCPGLKLEGLELRGFQGAALRLQDCVGKLDDPASFKRLRLRPARSAGADYAVLFDRGPRPDIGSVNQYLSFHECRFEGPYNVAAVQFEGTVTDAEFLRNRFYRARAAFSYAKVVPLPRLRAAISSNTFAEIQTAFHFMALPPVDLTKDRREQDNRLQLRNNLFSKVPALVGVNVGLDAAEEKLRLLFESEGTVIDRESNTDGPKVLAPKALTFELSTDPTKDATFLRYTKTSVLFKACDNQPAGCPPVD